MSDKEKFIQEISDGYAVEGRSITLGAAMLGNEVMTNTFTKVPLKTLNRHGLIAGATGSGKTKTLQVLTEQLSAEGIPVVLMDIKGDLSGLAVSGEDHPKIQERHTKIGLPFSPQACPVEFLTISNENGTRLRATVSEFGPVLFSKILELNETQSGVVAVIFKYCDDNKLPLLDLKDFKKTIQWVTGEGKDDFAEEYGKLSTASTGAILRKIVELEQQGAELFFGEHSFDTEDLVRLDENGRGMVSVLRLTDIQDKPKLFSTFMLQMLAEIYATFPEEGDSEAPKLAIFIDEAHLVFNEASSALLDQIEAIVKLIRSKGVGLFFVTQNPSDIPDAVLGQLGLKIQHALRAFTAKDRKAIKLAAQNYPITEYYNTAELLTQLGIGEAFVTALSEKGIPTPLAHTMLRAPQTRMGVLSDAELEAVFEKSAIKKKYSETVDRESAYELLKKKIGIAQEEENQAALKKEKEKAAKATTSSRKTKEEKSVAEQFMNSSAGKTVVRELTRGLLGALGIKTPRRRGRNSWF